MSSPFSFSISISLQKGENWEAAYVASAIADTEQRALNAVLSHQWESEVAIVLSRNHALASNCVCVCSPFNDWLHVAS